jgi:hypothetical protein
VSPAEEWDPGGVLSESCRGVGSWSCASVSPVEEWLPGGFSESCIGVGSWKCA